MEVRCRLQQAHGSKITSVSAMPELLLQQHCCCCSYDALPPGPQHIFSFFFYPIYYLRPLVTKIEGHIVASSPPAPLTGPLTASGLSGSGRVDMLTCPVAAARAAVATGASG